MTLVPAFFTLIGEKTWYIPRARLDRMPARRNRNRPRTMAPSAPPWTSGVPG